MALGDILQIRPPLGSMIYSSPTNTRSKALYSIPGGNLWQKFDVITLKTNHRQGNDKSYADLLNRLRVGEHNMDDLETLRTRVFAREDPSIPNNALLITGENKKVKVENERRLSQLNGDIFEFEATVKSRTQGKFKPCIDRAGQVRNTPLQSNLKLKLNARVMLTINLDVTDNLANGSLGTVVDFFQNPQGEVKYVLVKFDDEDAGVKYRRELNFDHRYPGQMLTAIKKVEFEFQLKKGSTTTATAINFPLRLAWSTTLHKIQVF